MNTKENSVADLSVDQIIAAGRWSRALFATFTLSLTFFESQILPLLRKAGCQKVDIHVDAFGHRNSLVERHSTGAGRDYVVSPISITGGIFHPKLIHLWATDGKSDLLLVGSGNLTYSGSGGNIEVLEVLRADLHATAFLEAAAFLKALVEDTRADIADPATLTESAERLAKLGSSFGNVHDVHFVHSLRTSGLEQMTTAAAGQSVSDVRILSPYFSTDADCVRELVRRTGARRLMVGVDPVASTSPFNFPLAKSWIGEVRAAKPESSARRLHAKWIELRMDTHALILSGSFNATHTSFATTHNVECGVMRRISLPSTEWIGCPIPLYAPMDFPRQETRVCLTAVASLKGRLLEGRIIGANAVAGTWQLTLRTIGGPLADFFAVELSADGRFRHLLNTPPALHRLTAIQIFLRDGAVLARGWVALPEILELPVRTRTMLQIAVNFENGSESSRDYADVMDVLLEEVRTLVQDLAVPADAPGGAGPASGAGNGDAAGALLTPQEFSDEMEKALEKAGSRRSTGQESTMADATWNMIRYLGDLLAGTPETPASPEKPPRDEQGGRRRPSISRSLLPQSDEEMKEAEPRRLRDQHKLRRWQDAMDVQRDKLLCLLTPRLHQHANPVLASRLLLGIGRIDRTCLRTSLRVLLYKIKDDDLAFAYIGEWLHRISATPNRAETRETLLADVAGAGAVLALHWWKNGARAMAGVTNRAQPHHARVRQYLEYFFHGQIPLDDVLVCARSWVEYGFGAELIDGQTEQAVTALRAALAVTTAQSQARTILFDMAASGDRAPAHGTLLNAAALDILRDAARPERGRRAYGVVDFRQLESCPDRSCNSSYLRWDLRRKMHVANPELLQQLKVFGVSRCPRCRMPLIASDVAGVPR